MGERAPYSRVYWSIVDDEKFDKIFDDDHHLATWLRLLIAADAIWPASPALPLSARRPSVKALSEAGIVDLLTGHRYRIHGLDAERGRRKAAATTRGPDGTPNGIQQETERSPNGISRVGDASRDAILVSSQLVSSQDDVERGAGGDDPIVALNERTGQFPSDRVREWVNDLAEAHGEARLAAAIRSTPMTQHNVRDYLYAVRDQLRAEDHAAERVEEIAERQRLAEKRASLPDSDVTRQLREMLRAKEAERQATA